jgi:hypothetical protein
LKTNLGSIGALEGAPQQHGLTVTPITFHLKKKGKKKKLQYIYSKKFKNKKFGRRNEP